VDLDRRRKAGSVVADCFGPWPLDPAFGLSVLEL
jgi:hypothetical protein